MADEQKPYYPSKTSRTARAVGTLIVVFTLIFAALSSILTSVEEPKWLTEFLVTGLGILGIPGIRGIVREFRK